MSRIVLSLDKSNKVQFCEWLTDYCRRMRGGEYPYHGGGKYGIDYPYNVSGVTKIGFSAHIKQPPFSNGTPPPGIDQWRIEDPETNLIYKSWEWVKENVIDLSWLEVGDRLKVTINHEGAKWIIPPVFQILWAIKADYPETSDIITSYILKEADRWNLYLTALKNDATIADIIAEQAREEFNEKANQPNARDTVQPENIIYADNKRETILKNAIVVNVLNVLETAMLEIPRPAHTSSSSTNEISFQYFFTKPQIKIDKAQGRGRIFIGYTRTRTDSSGRMIVSANFNQPFKFEETISFECQQIQEGKENTVEVRGHYPIQYENTVWTKTVFDAIWEKMLQRFYTQETMAQVGAGEIEKPSQTKFDKMKEETKVRFRKAYQIYLTMCDEYKGDVLDGASQKAKPTIQDFRARVISEMDWEVADRRLRDVIAYGEANLIK